MRQASDPFWKEKRLKRSSINAYYEIEDAWSKRDLEI
jgi:hypothetical protein